MEILQNQKYINQCKDSQNTESTSNSGTFNMEQLRKEIESQILTGLHPPSGLPPMLVVNICWFIWMLLRTLVGDIDYYSMIEFLFAGSFDVVGCFTFVVDYLSDDILG
jgi:hypothetical protein